MTGIVDWAAERARMVIAFVILSIMAGTLAYVGLPKEGEPDIDIPGVFVSVPFPGISATDSEKLLIKPMETKLKELDGLQSMTATASESFAGVFLEFEFGWDKSATIADVRDKMNQAEAEFPEGGEQYEISEINFSEFPILVVSLSGPVPERTLLRLAQDLQTELEGMGAVLEVGLAGHRDEMLEVIIDPLALEAYNVTAGELINVVTNNNLLVPAGAVETDQGAFPVKIPSSFDAPEDVYNLPVKTNGDRVVTLGDLAQINLTFEDPISTARYNGAPTVALQVIKRKGFNIMDTAAEVRAVVDAEVAQWPTELQRAVSVSATLDQSRTVRSMISQLEGSVLTAIALVMIVVLASLGTRSALLVGFAIPTSFLLCFALLAVMGIAISNIVMFWLILAVGMLVDGAIVVVEYADKKIQEGKGPMQAFVEAAKRMFWPVVSSTATTLCAFLPMLFWPGVPGEFMGMLPVTLIFVLSASLVVALVYLPVIGGVSARLSRIFDRGSSVLRAILPYWARLILTVFAGWLMFTFALQTINPGYILGISPQTTAVLATLPGALLFVASAMLMSTALGSVTIARKARKVQGYRRTPFGTLMHAIVGNPVMPIVAVMAVIIFVVSTFSYFGKNNNGVEFFVESETEAAIVYVRARGNLSLDEKDRLLQRAEAEILATSGIQSAFAFAGDGGLNQNTGGSAPPRDTIGQISIEMIPWEDRPTVSAPWFDLPLIGYTVNKTIVDPAFDGDTIAEDLLARVRAIPGIKADLISQDRGPASGKPIHLRLSGDDPIALQTATQSALAQFNATPGVIDIEDSLPLPGIDWEITVDVEKAGRFGADVATVGAMVQLVTRGLLLDTMRVPSSDEEIEIRVRLPEKDRVLSTLDSLKVRTSGGLVPLANFITRQPVPRLAEINRFDGKRYFDVKANAVTGVLIYDLTPLGSDGAPLEDGAAPLGLGAQLTPEQVAAGAPYNLQLVTRATGIGALLGLSRDSVEYHNITELRGTANLDQIGRDVADGKLQVTYVPLTANERIATLNEWLDTNPFPATVAWEWTGDQEDQAESQAFLSQAFIGALGLMFIILLAQFNSVYNAVLVLLAVVLSTAGVLWGMLILGQTFSIIMTGTGIVALAGIVVNNNIVLIDTYQEYARYMPRIEAITRTAEARIRPVLLTTLTTMAGLAPMMFGLSFDFIGGGYSLQSPTALWLIQLATAVVFGLGIATVLTLIFTPSMLAIRYWATHYVLALARLLGRLSLGRSSQAAEDFALRRAARRRGLPEMIWTEDAPTEPPQEPEAETVKEDSPETLPEPEPEADPTAEGSSDGPKPPSPLRAAE